MGFGHSDAAKKIARQRFAKIQLGTDPAAERAAVTNALSFADVVERYLAAKKGALRPSTFREAQRYFARQWEPFKDRPIDSIKRADVAARLQEIIRDCGPVSAARARSNLSAAYVWALKEGLCQSESNPVTMTNDPEAGAQPRDRVLSDRELAIVWRHAGGDSFGAIIKLLILLGCRRNEIGALKWSELDLASSELTISGTRTKNHRTLTLPLPAAAIEILRSIPRHNGSDYVFGSRPFTGWSHAKLVLGRIATSGETLPCWVLHDARRTARSGLGRLGVRPDVAELVVNHAKGGIRAIYDRYSYDREIKTALTLWSDHVLAAVEGQSQKVVSLRTGKLT